MINHLHFLISGAHSFTTARGHWRRWKEIGPDNEANFFELHDQKTGAGDNEFTAL
jgi:hypothetical protein